MSLALTTVPLQASGELLHLLWYAEAGHRPSSHSHARLAGFSVISFYLAVAGVRICSGKSYLFPECVVATDMNHLYQLPASPEGSLSSISIFWDVSSNPLPAACHDLSIDHTTPAVSPSAQILGVLLCLGQALGFKLCRCSLSLGGIARSPADLQSSIPRTRSCVMFTVSQHPHFSTEHSQAQGSLMTGS